jgi:hypothetical protein
MTEDEDPIELFLTRRRAIHLILGTAAGSAAATGLTGCLTTTEIPSVVDGPVTELPVAKPRGTLTDPDLFTKYIPWEYKMTVPELRAATALCDLILPADDRSPAASEVDVPDFINDWVSAPYEAHMKDLELIQWGLAWIDAQALTHYAKLFTDLNETEQREICDPIAYREKPKPPEPGVPRPKKKPDPLAKQARFFSRFRFLTVGGFYTTEAGRKDLQFMGNVAIGGDFPGPPPEVLKHLGLA